MKEPTANSKFYDYYFVKKKEIYYNYTIIINFITNEYKIT